MAVFRGLRRQLGSSASVLAFVVLLSCQASPPTLDEIRSLLQQGRSEEALDSLRVLVRSDSRNPDVLFAYGSALWASGRAGHAYWALKLAMEDPEYYAPAGMLIVKLLMASQDWDQAERLCSEMLDELGERADILALRASARQGSRRNYEGAIEDADRALELEPDNRAVLIPRAASLLYLGKKEEAEEALQQLDELYRINEDGLKGTAKFCAAGAALAAEVGEVALARERYERCLGDFPDHPLLLSSAIEFFDGMGEAAESEAILRSALEHSPDATHARAALAGRLELRGQLDEAEEVLREGTRLVEGSDPVEWWFALGSFLQENDRPEDALEAYRAARKVVNGSYPTLDLRYADALLQAQRFQEALEWSRTLEPAAFRFLVKGRVELETGQPREALSSFEEGNRLWPNNAVARYYTALAAERVGDFDRAVGEYRYSLRVDRSATDAPDRLAAHYSAMGRDSEAINVLSLVANAGAIDLESRLLLLRLMARTGFWDEPPTDLRRMLPNPSNHARGAVAIANGIADRVGPAPALHYLESVRGLRLANPNARVVIERAVEWMIELGRLDDAASMVDTVLGLDSKSAALVALRGDVRTVTGDRAGARGDYEQALEIDPDNARALLGLGRQLSSGVAERPGGELETPIAYLRRAIAADPEADEAFYQLAGLLKSSQRSEELRALLKDRLRQQPWDARASVLLAEALVAEGVPADLEQARRRIAQAHRFSGGTSGLRSRIEALEQRI